MRVTKARGYTLIELVVVVGIIALVAVVAVPNTFSDDEERLQIAAVEFADAIRYARGETLRLGTPHGFAVVPDSRSVRLFRLDNVTFPAAALYDVRHPVSKQPYQFDIASHPFAIADSVTPAAKFFGGCATVNDIYFDKHGVPRCFNPETVALAAYEITLQLGSYAKTVQLDGLTGRVSVQ